MYREWGGPFGAVERIPCQTFQRAATGGVSVWRPAVRRLRQAGVLIFVLIVGIGIFPSHKSVAHHAPAKERLGRYPPESGLIMLTLSFVVHDPKRIWQIPSLDYLVGAGEDRRRHCETIQKPIFRQVSCWTLLGSFASGATMQASPVVSLCPPFCQAGAAHRTASISLTTCSAASPSAAIAAANRTAAARNRGPSSTRRIAAEI
jgi:hypothetical protein